MSDLPEMFQCPHYGGTLRLTVGACAKQFEKAKQAQRWDRLYPCRGCEIGARNAGEPCIKTKDLGHCLRCGNKATRLIRKQICVSCYNREREVLTGKYRRAHPPQGLEIESIKVAVAGVKEPVEIMAANRAEALMAAFRHRETTAVVAVLSDKHKPRWQTPCVRRQMVLPLGI